MAQCFGMDPVTILADPAPLHWAVRVAAYRQIAADEKQRADQARAK